ARIRAATTLPVALGFGTSRPEHVREVTGYADAAVVGSALVQGIADAERAGEDVGAAAERFTRWRKTGSWSEAGRRPQQWTPERDTTRRLHAAVLPAAD